MKQDNELYKEFGDKLKNLRKSKKVTQTQLANAVGSTQSTIYKYEKGIQPIPMSMLQAFAKFFETSITELIGVEPHLTNEDEEWIDEIKSYKLNNNEINELMNYVRFIVTKRD